ncbi:MAG: glycosyltransferase family 2 protein [Christensenellales bacterium]|jgi:cellulose synthase/poly-beta-1,6-N-acetylglucosamine synthase-like glycosyltransferase
METISFLNYLIAMVFMICYSYQFVYMIVALLRKPAPLPAASPRRYAVAISARNEQAVIAQLIDSIRRQKYPAECIDIFVVADNCTDETAAVARQAGAVVWERSNRQYVGKGYALAFLFGCIEETRGLGTYDGYFIFDADNLLDEQYIARMNDVFSAGYRIVTSYRNSKNYASNWISAGYSLWFIRESRYLNGARMLLGTSCAVSGTGFLVHRDIILRNGGWNHFLLTEDIEFTVDSILQGERIGYCHDAILYDEQPVTFGQSWRQRLRWAKGFLQVFHNYGTKMLRGIFAYGGFSCFDMMMAIFPAILLTITGALLNAAGAVVSFLYYDWDTLTLLRSVFETLRNAYGLLFAVGLVTVVTEWRRIHCGALQKIFYTFTFPLFMFTYIPISVTALFKKVEWTPIGHSIAKSLDDVRSPSER